MRVVIFFLEKKNGTKIKMFSNTSINVFLCFFFGKMFSGGYPILAKTLNFKVSFPI